MSLDKMLKKAIIESIIESAIDNDDEVCEHKHVGDKEIKSLSRKIKKEFEEKFPALAAKNYFIRTLFPDSESYYTRIEKYETNGWIRKGLKSMAATYLLDGGIVYTQYHELEKFLSEKGKDWIAVIEGESESDLLVLSNFKYRSEMIGSLD